MSARVRIDLWSDAAEAFNRELRELGFKDQSRYSPDDVCLKYVNAIFRRIPVQPRRFHFPKNFFVPKDREYGFNILKRKVELGQDLLPNMSSRLLKVDYQDGLLNDWYIHHFHLGDSSYESGLVHRTDEVLFAMVCPEDFYAICIAQHSRDTNPESFFDTELIEVLHSNWPEMMSQFRYQDIQIHGGKKSNQDHGLLRSEGIIALLSTSDGTSYHPPGMGVTSACTSVAVVRHMLHFKSLAMKLERTILDKLPALEETLLKRKAKIPFEFKLGVIDANTITAIEMNSGAELELFPVPGPNGYDCQLILRWVKLPN